jgi:DeoR/GlpR family transcriptional regulator of sugar metabolism
MRKNLYLQLFAVLFYLTLEMIKEERFEFILSALTKKDMIAYLELSKELQVSEDTIRRDIDYLHKNGLLSKVKGGAMARNKNPLTFQDRLGYKISEKEIIGKKAQQFLRDGMTIFMDGGSTVCAVVEQFYEGLSLKVVTNNLALVPLLSGSKNVELFILGGAYNKDTGTNVGNKTCEDAKQYVVDLYFMGSCAVSSAFGVTATDQSDSAAKKSMMETAKKVILLADSEKVGTNEFFHVCDLDALDMIITELPSDDSILDSLRFQNVTIV